MASDGHEESCACIWPSDSDLLSDQALTLPRVNGPNVIAYGTICRMDEQLNTSATFNLREQVEALLPNWQSWYPTLFEAACDLGVLRARVCDLSSLVLSNRHASVYNEAVQAFRNQWLADEPEAEAAPMPQSKRAAATLPRKSRETRAEVENFLAGFSDEDFQNDSSQDEVTPDDGHDAQDAKEPHQSE